MATETHPGRMTYSSDKSNAPIVNKTDARQGEAPNRVRYMLYFGIPIVIIGFIAAYFWAAH